MIERWHIVYTVCNATPFPSVPLSQRWTQRWGLWSRRIRHTGVLALLSRTALRIDAISPTGSMWGVSRCFCGLNIITISTQPTTSRKKTLKTEGTDVTAEKLNAVGTQRSSNGLCISCVVKFFFCLLYCTCNTCFFPPLLLLLLTSNATVFITFYEKIWYICQDNPAKRCYCISTLVTSCFPGGRLIFSNTVFMVLY